MNLDVSSEPAQRLVTYQLFVQSTGNCEKKDLLALFLEMKCMELSPDRKLSGIVQQHKTMQSDFQKVTQTIFKSRFALLCSLSFAQSF